MRNIIILCCLILTTSICAKNLKPDYKPDGQIVRFNFDSLIIYTDTIALFSVIDNYNDSVYVLSIRTLIMDHINNGNSDTIVFSGHSISFNDSLNNENRKNWYIDRVIRDLTDVEKLTIIDKHNNQVGIIKKKKVKWSREGYGMIKGTKISYINKDTGEELFGKILMGIIVDPAF